MNIVVVDGRLINDPVARKVDMQNGRSTSVVSFSIINENGKNKSLFNCEAWGPSGKDVMKFKSGDTVCVSGSMIQQSWDDKNSGEKKSSVKIRSNQVVKATLPSEVAESNGGSTQPGYQASGNQSRENQGYQNAPSPRREVAPVVDNVFDSVDF